MQRLPQPSGCCSCQWEVETVGKEAEDKAAGRGCSVTTPKVGQGSTLAGHSVDVGLVALTLGAVLWGSPAGLCLDGGWSSPLQATSSPPLRHG